MCYCSQIKANSTPILLHLKLHFPHFHPDYHTDTSRRTSHNPPLPLHQKERKKRTFQSHFFLYWNSELQMLHITYQVVSIPLGTRQSSIVEKPCELQIIDQLLLLTMVKKDLHKSFFPVSCVSVSLPPECWRLCSPASYWLQPCFQSNKIVLPQGCPCCSSSHSFYSKPWL